MPTLTRALRLSGTPAVAVVGAGGKTTAVFALARALAPSIVTVTAHLGAWQVGGATRHLVITRPDAESDLRPPTPDDVLLLTGALDEATNRYHGLPPDQVDRLIESARAMNRPVFIEADGSRQLPLKAPADHEPPVPSRADLVVVVAGLSGLGGPLADDTVHRAGRFGPLAGLEPGAPVTAEALSRVLAHPLGGLKNIPPSARRVALLNQADTPARREAGARIAPALLDHFDAVVVASLCPAAAGIGLSASAAPTPHIHAVHEPVAAVFLAAGASSRFGRPKALADYRGRPFVATVADTALAAGLSPVVVVTGAGAEPVEAALAGRAVTVVRNARWPEGQSTSVRAGLDALPARTGAAVFLVVDQPQAPEALVRALVARHAATLAPIVAPLAAGRRTTPTLFDRDLFAELRLVTGDQGGRALLSRHPVEAVEWPDPHLLLDVDTPTDYDRLLADRDRGRE